MLRKALALGLHLGSAIILQASDAEINFLKWSLQYKLASPCSVSISILFSPALNQAHSLPVFCFCHRWGYFMHLFIPVFLECFKTEPDPGYNHSNHTLCIFQASRILFCFVEIGSYYVAQIGLELGCLASTFCMLESQV